jgi:hypothetical protein
VIDYKAHMGGWPGQTYLALITLLLTLMASRQDRAFHLPFRDESGLILLDLKVNEKPAVLLLDTGATTTLFANAGLVEIRVAEHSVIAVHANELGRFNSTTRRNMALLGISGILGQDFLHKFKSVRIDYVNRFLELEPR